MDRVMKIASERAVVVFTLSSCCMCHTVTRLMADLHKNMKKAKRVIRQGLTTIKTWDDSSSEEEAHHKRNGCKSSSSCMHICLMIPLFVDDICFMETGKVETKWWCVGGGNSARTVLGCMERPLHKVLGGRGPAVPAVFIGGKLVGGTNRVMSLHLAGELVPMLKSAGALWL